MKHLTYILVTNNNVYGLRTKLLKATEENLKISQLMYENGIVNYIDVLDAQRNNVNAQQDLSSAVNSLQNARVRLYKSLGGCRDASAFTVRTDKKNRKEAIRWYIVRFCTSPGNSFWNRSCHI